MIFSLNRSIEILERTPVVVLELTRGLSSAWINTNEGEGTWTVFDVVGHLIHADKTDWIPRAEVILSDSNDKVFPPFDRFGQMETSKGKTLLQLLEEFKMERVSNIIRLRNLHITEQDFSKTGIHPTFGIVSRLVHFKFWSDVSSLKCCI